MQGGYLVGQAGDHPQVEPIRRRQDRAADLDQHAPGLSQNLPALLPPIRHFRLPALPDIVCEKRKRAKQYNLTKKQRATLLPQLIEIVAPWAGAGKSMTIPLRCN